MKLVDPSLADGHSRAPGLAPYDGILDHPRSEILVRFDLALACLAGLTAPMPAVGQRVVLSARVGAAASVTLDLDSLPRGFDAARGVLWDRLVWTPAGRALSWTEVQLAAGRLRIPVRAIVIRLDPRAYDLRLQLATAANGMTGTWTVDDADGRAALALNAGQFKETGPWGWLVLDGDERGAPGAGPLSVGIAVTDSGAVRWIEEEDLASARADPHIRWAFQTYPALLLAGRVPTLARDPRSVDQDHRDARLILGERPDGSLLVVLTRFDVLDAVARAPVGLTFPESVALMGALGVRNAAMLDGGISAQVALRGGGGEIAAWRGLRRVPLGLLAIPKPN